jgi:hypothetical protein
VLPVTVGIRDGAVQLVSILGGVVNAKGGVVSHLEDEVGAREREAPECDAGHEAQVDERADLCTQHMSDGDPSRVSIQFVFNKTCQHLEFHKPLDLTIHPNHPLLTAGGRVRLYTVNLYPNTRPCILSHRCRETRWRRNLTCTSRCSRHATAAMNSVGSTSFMRRWPSPALRYRLAVTSAVAP